METFKITYSYITSRGSTVEGKCLIVARNKDQALIQANFNKKQKLLTIISIKRAKN